MAPPIAGGSRSIPDGERGRRRATPLRENARQSVPQGKGYALGGELRDAASPVGTPRSGSLGENGGQRQTRAAWRPTPNRVNPSLGSHGGGTHDRHCVDL